VPGELHENFLAISLWLATLFANDTAPSAAICASVSLAFLPCRSKVFALFRGERGGCGGRSDWNFGARGLLEDLASFGLFASSVNASNDFVALLHERGLGALSDFGTLQALPLTVSVDGSAKIEVSGFGASGRGSGARRLADNAFSAFVSFVIGATTNPVALGLCASSLARGDFRAGFGFKIVAARLAIDKVTLSKVCRFPASGLLIVTVSFANDPAATLVTLVEAAVGDQRALNRRSGVGAVCHSRAVPVGERARLTNDLAAFEG
jgi:hypothetical protein